jgi:hypothetical protein
MKTATIQWTIMCLLTLVFTRMSAVPPEHETSVRGAASNADLTEVLFQAIKNNDFETLLNYMPDEHHLEILRAQSNALDKGFYEELSAGSIRDQMEENFNGVIKSGIDNEVNWSSLQLMEKRSKDMNSLKNICTTVLVMEDNKEVPLSFSFDSIEISNRWFIIQGLRTEEKPEIGLVD